MTALVLLLTVLAAVAVTSAAPGPQAAAAAHSAPAQPIPPNPSCAPGSAEPICNLPSTSPSHTIPATPLPPITTVPGPDPSCFPGSVLPGCGPIGSPPTTSAPPCTGLNCIPQPTTLAPTAPPVAPIPGSGAGDANCGFTDMTGCMINAATALFATVVAIGLNPLMDLLGKTLLTTPEPSDLPGLGAVWTQSWHVLLTAYVVLVLLAGIILMAYETLQSRYTVKEIAPRLVVGFLAGTLSLLVATTGIQIANALSWAVMGNPVDPATVTHSLTTMVQGSLAGSGGLFLALLALGLQVMLLVLLITFIVRVILTILLIAAAPIALMFHALPHTEGIAYGWWKAFGGVLAIQVGQSLTLVIALKIFFAPGGFTLFGPTVSGLTNLLLCIALMFVLIKIPFWALSSLRSGRRSMIGSLIRGVIAYKTMGLLAGGTSRGGGKNPRASGRPSAPMDPPATRSGQYMLPMTLRRVHKPFRTQRRRWDEHARPDLTGGAPGPGQMSLFTTRGHGRDRTVGPNPRAVTPTDLPNALPRDQLGLPITVRRDPDRAPRRTLADDLAAGQPPSPPVRQPGLLMPDGRINRQARPPAKLPNALLAPGAGMLPIHLPPQTPRRARHMLADQLADPTRSNRAPQTGPGLLTASGQINPAARALRRPARDAYTGTRPLASGQYLLPLGVHRQPKPAAPAQQPPTPPTVPARPARLKRTGTQLPLPLDLPARPRRPKKK